MKYTAIVLAALLACCSPALAITENFDATPGPELPAGWEVGTVEWAAKDGVLTHRDGEYSFTTFHKAGAGEDVVVEATVVVSRRASGGWAAAAVTIRQDDENYWHIALIEAPPANGGKRFVEVVEKFHGEWHAQSAEATKLKSFVFENQGFEWEFNHPYRLRLAMRDGRIEGTVAELDGTVRSRIGYELSGTSVSWGMPALGGSHLATTYDDVRAEVAKPHALPASPSFPKYDAAGGDEYRGKATGYFHTETENGRDWIVDPNGKAFYWIGVDHVSYRGHWCEKLGYPPYAREAEKKYGSEEAWDVATLARLKAWGFNTLPTGQSKSLLHRGLAHIEFVAFGASFAGVDGICEKTTWTGFPNVFSPDWPRHCEILARRKSDAMRNDPWLVGYFLDNELEWYGKKYSPRGLFDESWKKPANHTAKQGLVAFVKRQTGSIASFNEQFGTSFASFDQLAADTTPHDPRNAAGTATAGGFVRLVAELYFKTCHEALKKADPNHMNLGCRFAGQAPDVWDIAGKYCDIVSLNTYPRIDVDRGVPANVAKLTDDWHALAGKPMAITEWSFPALDAGLPSRHGAGMRVDTQAQRASCFSFFQDYMFRTPYIVGSSYFMYIDEPALGISASFPEDSNYGLINGQDEPYPAITAAATKVNRDALRHHKEGNFKPASVPDIGAPSWTRDAKMVSGDAPRAFNFKTGNIALDFPAGGSKWSLSLNGKLVAEVYPLVHLRDGVDFWLPAANAKILTHLQTEKADAVDIEFGFTPAPTDPRTAKAVVRYWIPKDGGGWMASQALSVENTGTKSWRLGDFYHYMMPKTDGSLSQIVTLSDVPSYYRMICAWADKQRGLTVGAWYAPGGKLGGEYWKDCDTCFHSDVHEKVDLELAPGAMWTACEELVFFFAQPGITRDSHGAACDRVAEDAGLR